VKPTLIISPYSRKLINGKQNAKNYPYWKELVNILNKKFDIIQIGNSGEDKIDGCADYKFNLSFDQLKDITLAAETFISVDNFYPHFCNTIGKYGFVIWGKSDPNIFGYEKNINIIKDRKFLRPDQFNTWEDVIFNANVFKKLDISDFNNFNK